MSNRLLIPADRLRDSLASALAASGACPTSVEAAVRALMHASRLGVDSHGARLVMHYDRVLRSGRVNGQPQIRVKHTGTSTAVVDGDDGLGHHVAYAAMTEAIAIARETGVGAVGAIRSSHYGAAGAYALAAAEAGMIGFATTNADSVVAPFDGAKSFHGTNPLAFAAPSGDEKPWLLDMATSSIPMNRVLLYRTLGTTLPEGVAAAAGGTVTRDAAAAEMLLPLGGSDFGFKGAALAGVATVLSAVLQGTALDHDMIPMIGGDMSSPRNMGHFFLAIDPARFGGREVFAAGMAAYLAALRAVPGRDGAEILAPGDREWRVEAERLRDGIPIDLTTAEFLGLSAYSAGEPEAPRR
ncbi:Ldh family oxidoreductase [Kumtagia ephedrae]|uniref:Ldh family oxidoreductase n=1 Tax=Kumtagia ephedrae TaxID=2116701 RepID=UPI003CC94A3A